MVSIWNKAHTEEASATGMLETAERREEKDPDKGFIQAKPMVITKKTPREKSLAKEEGHGSMDSGSSSEESKDDGFMADEMESLP